MKWFFILLLAANLLYLGWEMDRQIVIDDARNSEALPIPARTNKLALLKELPSPPAPRVAPDEQTGEGEFSPGADSADGVPVPAIMPPMDNVMIEEKYAHGLQSLRPDTSTPDHADTPDSGASMCFSFGPFPDAQQSVELKTWFDTRQVRAQQRQERDKENQLFWIYLAPQESLGGAMQAIEDLKKKGIADYRLIKTGDLRNAISLGLFSSQASVNKRLSELKGKGYQPVVVPYREGNHIYWVDVQLINQGQILNQMMTDYPSRYNSVPIDCNEIAMLPETP